MKIKRKFLPLLNPPKNIRYVIFYGGRGGAKSFTTMTTIMLECMRDANTQCLATRYVLGTSEDSIVNEFAEKVENMNIKKYWNIKGTRNGVNADCNNGASVIFRGIVGSRGNQTAKLKSIQGITTWIAEEASEMTERDFDTINLSIRSKMKRNLIIIVFNPESVGHWLYQRFFKQKINGRDLPDEYSGIIGDTLYIHCDYRDNVENLEASFLNEAEKMQQQNIKKYNHLFLGHWRRGNEMGFQLQNFNQFDVKLFPINQCNIYLIVDPASGKKKEKGDYTVMVVIALAQDGNYYLLDGIRKKLKLNEKWHHLKIFHGKYNPIKIGYEEYGMQADIEYFQDKMNIENYRFPITPLGGKLSKIDRINKLIPIHELNKFYYPMEKQLVFQDQDGVYQDFVLDYLNNEFLRYPENVAHYSLHDDMLDAIARILDKDLSAEFPLLNSTHTASVNSSSHYDLFKY